MSLSGLLAKPTNICLNAPIQCQICLAKVREPVVCPNLHPFCSFCIEIWLEKSKQCPTCRIPITKDNPFRKVIGYKDDSVSNPASFSHANTRKARINALFNQYESEINVLLKQIDVLTSELNNVKQGHHYGNFYSMSEQDLNRKQKVDMSYEDLLRERDKLKEMNKKLQSENCRLIKDIQRLASHKDKKVDLENYQTIVILGNRLEVYEKEIKRLKRELDKSYIYINELEKICTSKRRKRLNEINHSNDDEKLLYSKEEYEKSLRKSPDDDSNISKKNSSNLTKFFDSDSDDMKYIKGDSQTFKNELKVVKFADELEEISRNKNSEADEITNKYLSQNGESTNHNSPNRKTPHAPSQTNGMDYETMPVKITAPKSPDVSKQKPYHFRRNFLSTSFNLHNLNKDKPYSHIKPSTSTTNDTYNSKSDFVYTQSNYDNIKFDKEMITVKDILGPTENSSKNGQENINGNSSPKTSKNFESSTTQSINTCSSGTNEFTDCLHLLNEAETKLLNKSIQESNNYQKADLNGSSSLSYSRPSNITKHFLSTSPRYTITRSSTVGIVYPSELKHEYTFDDKYKSDNNMRPKFKPSYTAEQISKSPLSSIYDNQIKSGDYYKIADHDLYYVHRTNDSK